MGKRANGEGSIYRRKSDGRWCASLPLANGRRKHYLGKTRGSVSKQLNAALDQREKGTLVVAPRQSVAQFLNSWLETAKPTLRERTHTRYEEMVRLHVVPVIGKRALTALTPQDLQQLYAEKLKTLSPTTVHHLHSMIRRALSMAVKWDALHRNVADAVPPPRMAKYEITPLTPEQARRLVDAAQGMRLEALIVLAVTTGMREGELLGLRWSDVDLPHGRVQIRGSMQATKNGLKIAEPKTRGSTRQVTLAEVAQAALRSHKVAQNAERLRVGGAWEDNNLVFANEVGRPIAAGNLIKRIFRPLLLRAGVPQIRFHDLRHTAATLLLGKGTNPKIVAEMLGHTRISTTLDLYSHVTPTMQQEAAAAFDEMLAR